MDERAAASQEVWCRLVTAGARVLRVQIMHPDGQVLAAYSPERFDPEVLRQMLAGQIRGAVIGPDPVVRLSDLSGTVVFEDRLGSPPPG